LEYYYQYAISSRSTQKTVMKKTILFSLIIGLLVGCTMTFEISPRKVSFKKSSSKEASFPKKEKDSKIINQSKSISFSVKDSKKGELHYIETNGEASLKAIDSKGEVVFDGPINSENQLSKVPTVMFNWLNEVKREMSK
jgi:archaellum component FlaG (FlaF/FlaG flagellin family)